MTRALLITNPIAARHDARALTAMRETLRQGGWTVEVAATVAPTDARRLAEQGRADGFDAMLAYGGDGTAIQVAAALAGTDIPLGLLPGGTGNVLARNLRLPVRPVPAARTILKYRPQRIDLGVVEREGGPQYFAVCCGAGFDAAVMLATDTLSKRRWRRAAYLRAGFTALFNVVSSPHRFIIDGVETRLPAAMALVCNCADLMPPLLRMHPDIRPDDGLLDIVVLRATGAWQSVTALTELLVRRQAARDQVWFARGRAIRIETDNVPVPTQLDGDVAGTTPLDIRVLPGALTVFVDPKTTPGAKRG